MRRLILAGLALAALGSAPAAAPAQAGSWRALFDGTSMDAWRGYKAQAVPEGWSIVDRTLTKSRPVADIVTKEQFADFELELDWRIGPAGNSGVFYRGSEEEEHIYWTAPEYVLLDDIKARDNRTRLTCAGAVHSVYPSPEGHLKPVGEWNATRIVAKGPHIEHWLNGAKVVEYELWSADWEAKVAASKFKVWPKYGRLKSGHIALQGDHGGELAFRNIRIRTLQ